MNPIPEEISCNPGVAYQNFQKRLKAANGDEFSHGLTFIERTLTAHVHKSAQATFTLKREARKRTRGEDEKVYH